MFHALKYLLMYNLQGVTDALTTDGSQIIVIIYIAIRGWTIEECLNKTGNKERTSPTIIKTVGILAAREDT